MKTKRRNIVKLLMRDLTYISRVSSKRSYCCCLPMRLDKERCSRQKHAGTCAFVVIARLLITYITAMPKQLHA